MKQIYSYYVLDIGQKGHLLKMRNSKAIAGEDGKLILGILNDEAVMEKKPRPTISPNPLSQPALALTGVLTCWTTCSF